MLQTEEEPKLVEKNDRSNRSRVPSYGSNGSQGRNSFVADIPEGLVRQKREIAQKEQVYFCYFFCDKTSFLVG